jgi:signal transduction histidine kinase
MIMVTAVIIFGNIGTLDIKDLIYLNIVALVFLILYLIASFAQNKRFFDALCYAVKNTKEDILTSIPSPITYEQKLYTQLIKNIYEEQTAKLENFYTEKRENIEFITSWVHEVKTPIAVSRLIIENSTDKSKDEILSSLEDELDKIDNYVEQSLYYSRIDTFSRDYLIDEIDIGKVVTEVIKRNAKIFINKKIKIDIQSASLEILTDKKWLYFILNQIVSNSLKYTAINGTIKIYGRTLEKERQLIIEDNGIGIKAEDLDRIFDKGFTGFNGRNNTSSTGMGLYLAQKLARKLGHNITAESSFGHYTKLTLHFPKLMDFYNHL